MGAGYKSGSRVQMGLGWSRVQMGLGLCRVQMGVGGRCRCTGGPKKNAFKI